MFLIETVSSTAAGTVQIDSLDSDLSKILNVPRDVIRTVKRFGCYGSDGDFTEVKMWKGSELICKAGIQHAAAYSNDTMLDVGVDFNNEKIVIELTGANAVSSETFAIEWADRKYGRA